EHRFDLLERNFRKRYDDKGQAPAVEGVADIVRAGGGCQVLRHKLAIKPGGVVASNNSSQNLETLRIARSGRRIAWHIIVAKQRTRAGTSVFKSDPSGSYRFRLLRPDVRQRS